MRGAFEYLAALLRGGEDGDEHRLDYAVILGLIVIVVILAFVFLGDPIADLVTTIGGRVDQETLPK
jgi:Flp pilus assembly pilin Flp